MKLADVNAVTAAVANWAIERNDIRAMAMLGSWVRGNPRPDSDLDLLLLSDLAPDYQRSKTWLTEIDFQNAGFQLQSNESAFYGVVWSQHLHLLPAAEVELTFAQCSWAGTDPVDIGTQVIVIDAFQIIFDRDGILAKLIGAVMQE
jgi:predicted nucleotidyltransferase